MAPEARAQYTAGGVDMWWMMWCEHRYTMGADPEAKPDDSEVCTRPDTLWAQTLKLQPVDSDVCTCPHHRVARRPPPRGEQPPPARALRHVPDCLLIPAVIVCSYRCAPYTLEQR